MGNKLYTASEAFNEQDTHHRHRSEHDTLEDDAGPAEMIEEQVENLVMAEEAFSSRCERLFIAQGIQQSMQEKTICSAAYVTTLENYRPVLQALFQDLGLQRTFPSMEDFTNTYSASSAHQIATEGIKEFIKKVWEQIKEVFSIFFKKISLFVKRLVKANLQMEDYERYLDPMMAKLRVKTGGAKITDTKPFDSKLPMLLANEGMEEMSVEFLINHGVRKTEKLLKLSEQMGFQGIGKLNKPDGLPKLQTSLQAFIAKHKVVGNQPVTTLEQDATELYSLAMGLLTEIFPFEVKNPRDLPEAVYSSIYESFTHAQMGEGFQLRCLSEVDSGNDSLPREANVFFASSVAPEEDILVEGHLGSNTYVKGIIGPPETFANLQNMYDFYKNRVKKVQVSQADKNLDKINTDLTKIIATIQRELVPIVEKTTAAQSSKVTAENFGDLLASAIGKGHRLAELMSFVSSHHDNTRSFFDTQSHEAVVPMFDMRDTNSREFKNRAALLYSSLSRELPDFNYNIEAFCDYLKTLAGIGGESGMSQEELEKAKEIMNNLNRSLVRYFSRLQTTIRFLMSNIYAVYTELRYEWVRYIYMSAQRYTTI